MECDGRRIRFYDAYWAPVAVGGTTATRVFWWLMAQMKRPFQVLFSPWRSFASLRSATLETFKADPAYPAVLQRYWQFVVDRDPKETTFAHFLKYFPNDAELAANQRLARTWRRACRWNEVKNATLLAVVGVTIIGALALLGMTLFAALGVVARFAPTDSSPLGVAMRNLSTASLEHVMSLGALLLAMLGISGFMRDSLGDVQEFVTYEETDELHARRDKILTAAEETLCHVLADDQCSRVVVVAHSLGTAVAYDTMLRLRARNQAAHPDAHGDELMTDPVRLDRIQHFVTSGSPIDKINYFFATFSSATHSLEEMVDLLRGDIASVPFCWPPVADAVRRPHVRWINFWDRGDLISASLETVNNQHAIRQSVTNVQIATYSFPDFEGSHGGYSGNETYASSVVKMIFDNAWSWEQPPDRTPDRPEPRPVDIPSVAPRPQYVILVGLLGAAPIAVVIALDAGLGWLPPYYAYAAVAVVAVFLASIGWHRLVAWRRRA